MNRQDFTLLALLVSIAVNLLLVGGIGYRMATLPEPRLRPLPPGAGWVLRDLDQARRDELAPLIEDSENEIRAARDAMFASQRRINELIIEEDLDISELDAAFSALRNANQRYQELSHQQTAFLLEELNAAERQQVLEFIRRGGPRGPGEPGEPAGGPGGPLQPGGPAGGPGSVRPPPL